MSELDATKYLTTKLALLDMLLDSSIKIREEHENGETNANRKEQLVSVESLIHQFTPVDTANSKEPENSEINESHVKLLPERPKSSRTRPKTGGKERLESRNLRISREATPTALKVSSLAVTEFVRKTWKEAVENVNVAAATKIQALWRGFCVRKKLHCIQAQVEAEINQMLFEEDLQLDEDIDLDEFTYTEEVLC